MLSSVGLAVFAAGVALVLIAAGAAVGGALRDAITARIGGATADSSVAIDAPAVDAQPMVTPVGDGSVGRMPDPGGEAVDGDRTAAAEQPVNTGTGTGGGGSGSSSGTGTTTAGGAANAAIGDAYGAAHFVAGRGQAR